VHEVAQASTEPRLVAVDSGEGRHNHVMLHHEFLRNTYTETSDGEVRFDYGHTVVGRLKATGKFACGMA
jgi:hypothetical protein